VWVWCLVGLACVDDLVTFALDMRLVLVHQASPALFLLLAGCPGLSHVRFLLTTT
jgi:hypothetical protein